MTHFVVFRIFSYPFYCLKVPEDEIHAVVIHGADIPAMSEDDWAILVRKKEIVFARTSPEQKLKIVKEFTAVGNITAMTGEFSNCYLRRSFIMFIFGY